LIAVDDFSRYVVLIVLPKLDSATVRDAFVNHILASYGKPERVRTDKGSEFHKDFDSLMKQLGIRHIFTRP
jgi:transposase InsO family protein